MFAKATLNWIAIGYSVGIGLELERAVSISLNKALEPQTKKLNTWWKEQNNA